MQFTYMRSNNPPFNAFLVIIVHTNQGAILLSPTINTLVLHFIQQQCVMCLTAEFHTTATHFASNTLLLLVVGKMVQWRSKMLLQNVFVLFELLYCVYGHQKGEMILSLDYFCVCDAQNTPINISFHYFFRISGILSL